jgi:two-component system, chemotaxis family, response regulator Rcp1
LLPEGDNAGSPRPDFILLDLNLPKMDGREVLARIKQHKNLKSIPTIILTTSEAEADILRSYELMANCYLTKPVQLESFEALVKSLDQFWLTKAQITDKWGLALNNATSVLAHTAIAPGSAASRDDGR